MKASLLTIAMIFSSALLMAQTMYEYKVVSSIESIIPAGLGRSRLLMSDVEVDYEQFTTERSDGTDSDQGSIKRKDIKIDELEETKLLNFYSPIGINFQNIASNDAMITSMLNSMSSKGWELYTTLSGVESDAGSDDGQGIFITRYIFRRPIQK